MSDRALTKLFFHISLIGGPFTAWPFLLVATLLDVKDEEFLRWRRHLLTLALVDTALLLAVATVVAPALMKNPAAMNAAAPGQKPVIGVSLKQDAEDAPVEIAAVVDGGPAARAGIVTGDVVQDIDGTRVTSVKQAQELVANDAELRALQLHFLRSGETRDVSIVPVRSRDLRPPSRGLFEPESKQSCRPYQTNASVPWALLFSGAVVLLLWWLGRRRGMDTTLLWAGGLLLGVSLLTQTASLVTCAQVGGPSRGGVFVSLYVQTVVLIAGGLWLMKRMGPGPVPAGPPSNWILVALAGALYMLSGAVRVAFALLAASYVFGFGQSPYSDSLLHQVGGSGLSVGAALAFVLPVAILGPISEELLFRGVVLPWLLRWQKPWTAIVVSAAMFGALHLFYGPYLAIVAFYGLVLGWARVKSGGVKASIALHMAINGTASAVLLLSGRI